MTGTAPTIFLSYRREDSAGHTGRVADALGARFGPDHVFQDVEGIAPGEDFVEAVRRAIATCDVVLVVIGREWLDARDGEGRRRLDDPADHVRQEIAIALARDTVRVIPLLVQSTAMPPASDLPPDIAHLARRNALPLSDIGWEDDVARLIAAIEQSAPRASTAATPKRARANDHRRRLQTRIARAAAVIGLLVVSVLAVRARQNGATDASTVPAAAPAPEVEEPLASRALTMPGQLDASLGLAIVSLRSLRIDSFADGERLVAGFRLENRAEVSLPFLRREFQLDLGGRRADALGDADTHVPAGQTADVDMAFPLDPGATAALLRFRHATEVVEIPLDLRPGREGTPSPPNPSTVELTAAEPLALGGLGIAVEHATVRRFVNRDQVTLRLRIRNAGETQHRFTSEQLRLIMENEIPEPTSASFELLIPRDGQAGDSAVFRAPSGARVSALLVTVGDEDGTIPLVSPASR